MIDRDALVNLIKSNPDASERELSDSLWAAARGKADLRLVFDYWFGNMLRTVEVVKTAHTVAVIPRVQRQRKLKREEERIADAATRQKTIDIEKARLRSQIVLMNFALPDGTLLRNATFGQLRQLSGFAGDVGKLGNVNEIVGRKLTEANLQDLWARHTLRNAKAA